MPKYSLILIGAVYGFCVLSNVLVSASAAAIEWENSAVKCEKIHRVPYHSQYRCGQCKIGYYENVNKTCVSECSDCKLRHRKPCRGASMVCGPCVDPYIDIAGICITMEGADRAIRTLERVLASRPADASPADPSSDNHAVKKAEEIAKVYSNSDIVEPVPSVPTETKQDNMLPANKRVIDDETAKADVEISEAESDGASVGFSKLLFFCIIAGAAVLCLTSIIIAGVCWYRLHKVRKSMQPAEYSGYAGGDNTAKDSMARSDSSGDRKLAHSAQMYHYQHHKQQMMAAEKSLSDRMDDSDAEEPEENEDGNYTVYECPGLAPAGEMEVSNPLFQVNNKASSPSTSPTSSPASMPSPPQSGLSSSHEVDETSPSHN